MKPYSAYLLIWVIFVLTTIIALATDDLLVCWGSIIIANIYMLGYSLSIQIDRLKEH